MRVDHDDAIRGGVDDRAPSCFTRTKLLVESHPLAEIVEHAGELAFALDRHLADREMERERCAVATAPGHLTATADDRGDACVEIPAKIRVVLFVIRRRHQHVDVAADRLGRGIPEQPFGAAIEGLNRTFAVDDDDAVNRRIDDRVEPLRTLGRQLGFRAARTLSGAELMIGPRDS